MNPKLFARAIVSIEQKYKLRIDAQDMWIRLDGTPCGRGWVGTKPGCKRGKSLKEVGGLKSSTLSDPEEGTKGKLKDTLQQLKSKLEASIEKDNKASAQKMRSIEKKEKPPKSNASLAKIKEKEENSKKSSKSKIPEVQKDPIVAKVNIPKDFLSLREEFQKPSQDMAKLQSDLLSARDAEKKALSPSQKNKSGKLRREVEDKVRAAIKKDKDLKTELVAKYINKNKADPKAQTRHGMSETEQQWSIDLGGVKVHSADEVNKDSAAVQFAVELVRRKPPYPAEFLSHTTDIHFAATRNASDSYWEKKYNIPGFISAATGGDGSVVVYSGKTIPLSAFSHEAGHNLASALYGSENPPNDSHYAKSTQKLSEVSAYAKNSIGESFAEDVANYFDRPKILNSMEKTDPERYKTIKEIIEGSKDRSYAKKTLADYR